MPSSRSIPTVSASTRSAIADRRGAARSWHRLLFDAETFTTYLAYEGRASSDALTVGLRVAVRGQAVVIDPVSGERRPVASSRVGRGDVESRGVGAADRPAHVGEFQRRRGSDIRGPDGSRRRTPTVGGRDRRRPPPLRRTARHRGDALSRQGADGTALQAQPHRFGLRRRHREQLFRRSPGNGMGGVVVLGEWIEVGLRSTRLSTAAGGEGAVAAARTAAESGLSLYPRGHRTGGRHRLLPRPLRAGHRCRGALSRHGVDRPADLRARQGAGRSDRGRRRRWRRTRRFTSTTRWPRSRGFRCGCSRA